MPELRKVVFVTLLAAFGLGVAGCENTIRGAGQDIQETGEAIEDTAEGNP